MTDMTDQDDVRVREVLDGLEFPAERDEVVAYAHDHGADDAVVLEAVESLPDRLFSTVDDVVISVPEPADQS